MPSDFDLLFKLGADLQKEHRSRFFRHVPRSGTDGPRLSCRFEHTGASGGSSTGIQHFSRGTELQIRARITWPESELKRECVTDGDRFTEEDGGNTWMLSSAAKLRSGQVTVEIHRADISKVGSL